MRSWQRRKVWLLCLDCSYKNRNGCISGVPPVMFCRRCYSTNIAPAFYRGKFRLIVMHET